VVSASWQAQGQLERRSAATAAGLRFSSPKLNPTLQYSLPLSGTGGINPAPTPEFDAVGAAYMPPLSQLALSFRIYLRDLRFSLGWVGADLASIPSGTETETGTETLME
jgi:hypothetical protein